MVENYKKNSGLGFTCLLSYITLKIYYLPFARSKINDLLSALNSTQQARWLPSSATAKILANLNQMMCIKKGLDSSVYIMLRIYIRLAYR